MGSKMLESQDMFATPMSNYRHGSRSRRLSSTNDTPPQSPSRSVKRKSLVKTYDAPSIVKEPGLPKCEEYCNSQQQRKNRRNSNKDDKTLWSLMGYETYTQKPKDLSCSDIEEPNCRILSPKRGTPFHECETHYSSTFICAGLVFLMLISGFTGALCYSFVYERYIRNTDSSSILEKTGLNLPEESPIHILVSDLESSLSFLSAATQNQISQLKRSVHSLSQELVTTKQACQNKQKQGQIESSPGQVYEELLGPQADLASAWNLGSVLATPDTETVKLKYFRLSSWLSYFVATPSIPASTTIMGLIRDVGDCWMFVGQQGRLVVALHKPSTLSSVSITHIASDDMLSAPRHFSVLAHYSEEDLENGVSLGEFEYKKNGPWRQSFLLNPKIVKDEWLRLIEFKFLTNHGNLDFTCIYRVHVHGNTLKKL